MLQVKLSRKENLRLMRRILGVLAMSMVLGATLAKADITIYNSIPNPLPQNLPSLGFECCQVSEVGELIQFGSTYRDLKAVSITMSNWAYHSTYPDLPAEGFTVPITLNLYSVKPDNSVGDLITREQVTALIPWRPDSVGCGSYGTGYFGPGGTCYNGTLSQVTFDFAGITLPDQIIYGVAYNTYSGGYHPTGVSGPYDSLNVAFNVTGPATVGSNPLPDTAYIGGPFGQETGWDGYNVAATFTAATPEPGSIFLFGTLLAGVGVMIRKRKSA